LFISRQQVVDYVTGYAHMMQVKINFGESVVWVDRVNDVWTVQTKRNDGTDVTYNPTIVVVATGECIAPIIPTFPDQDQFQGAVVHSSTYKTAEDYRGKKALVIGFGNTGGELSVDLHEHGCDVSVIVRSPVNVVKRQSLILAASIVRHLPVWTQLALEWAFYRLDFGDMHKYGIICPVPGLENLGYYRLRKYHESPVVDIGQIDLIRKKLIKVQKYEVERFTPTGVVFKNGEEEPFDVVILATGFKPNLDKFLSETVYNATVNKLGYPHATAKSFPGAPGLYFVGFADETGRILKIKEDAIKTANFIKKDLSRGV